jgi:hypothetical protein
MVADALTGQCCNPKHRSPRNHLGLSPVAPVRKSPLLTKDQSDQFQLSPASLAYAVGMLRC